jgi:hypothetical protein
MRPGAEPPTTPEDELAVAFVAEGDLLGRKVRALRAQASQVEAMVQAVGVDVYARQVADEGFREPQESERSPEL